MIASGAPPPPAGPRLTALTTVELIALLEKSGPGKIAETDVAAAVQEGAPQNADGTFNLLSFAAWLARPA